ncbi:MAG: hypothetical protein COV70_02145 [Parcubacteria group bacterium CG11_big_fil_rev_8_21_14_0_20_39_22]|nr:MAG: hypothetical protein COV70_02145 [Parcubacteria group bacterium CG11_big_fil_rev_8_21_14_0_20_39_22]
MFTDEKNEDEVAGKIRRIISEEVKKEEKVLTFGFDFGSGRESATVELVDKNYSDKNKGEGWYELPDKIGMVVLYASQGPGGTLVANEEMKSAIVDGGMIWEETTAIIKKGNNEEIVVWVNNNSNRGYFDDFINVDF